MTTETECDESWIVIDDGNLRDYVLAEDIGDHWRQRVLLEKAFGALTKTKQWPMRSTIARRGRIRMQYLFPERFSVFVIPHW